MTKKKKVQPETEPSAEETSPEREASREAPPVEEAAGEAPPAEAAAGLEEAKKNWELYLRARADLENFRKRTQREKEELARFANENLIREILPVLDNLERALEHAQQGEDDNEGLRQGVEMTLGQLQKVLEKFGATPFASQGVPFDPSRHEALGQLESKDQPPGTVAKELQKGYLLNDRLLRPALVMVAKAPPEDPAGSR